MASLAFVETSKAPQAIGPYSQGVKAGGLLFVSGQLGIDPATGRMIGEGFADQARQALKNLLAIVQAAGAAVTDIAAVDVFVTDMSRFKEFNAIYTEAMQGHKPARAVVQVSALPLGGLVEVKCVAVAGK